MAQTCLEEGIIFEIQSQIDGFNNNYPNCEHVLGEVIVNSANFTEIQNLEGLTQLKRIDNLNISFNSNLSSLYGLHNVEVIDSGLVVQGNHSLEDLEGLNSLSTIGSRFWIQNNDSLITLSGLDALTNIESFNITQNKSLLNTQGLSKLDTIRGGMEISSNPALKFISMDSLKYVRLELGIQENNILDSLIGFPSLGYTGVLRVEANDSLKVIDGFNNFSTGNIRVVDNGNLEEIAGFTSLVDAKEIYIARNDKMTDVSGFNQVKNNFSVVIVSQDLMTEISGFNNLESIETLGLVGNPALLSVSGFQVLDSIHTILDIQGNELVNNISGLDEILFVNDFNIQDTELQSLDEFDSLDTIGTLRLYENTKLKSLEGFENLKYANSISLLYSDSLTNLNGFNSLVKVEEYFSIAYCPIDDISALSQLSFIGNLCAIGETKLVDLEGLSSLTTLGGLWLNSNSQLTSLNGLEQVNPETISLPWDFHSLEIQGNFELETCNQNFICEWINYPDVYYEISNNKADCLNNDTVKSSCSNSVNSIEDDRLVIYPNPAGDFVEFESNREQNYYIYDMTGCLHLTGTLVRGSNTVSLNTLAKGTYNIQVMSDGHHNKINSILIRM